MDKYNRNNEDWKPIVGFSGYEVSNFGRVRSLDRIITRKDGTKQFCEGIIMKQTPDKDGYLRLTLRKQGKRHSKRVHRLVGEAFISDYSDNLQMNHIDEVKTNNKVDNLECATSLENNNHGTRNKRISMSKINGKKAKAVVAVNIQTKEALEFPSGREAERQSNYFFRQGSISNACLGKQKQYKGYVWKYKEQS